MRAAAAQLQSLTTQYDSQQAHLVEQVRDYLFMYLVSSDV